MYDYADVILNHYWWMFKGIFVLLTIGVAVNTSIAFIWPSHHKGADLSRLVISFILLLTLAMANLFSGVLYDEFNSSTDNSLLWMSGLAFVFFLLQIGLMLKNTGKNKRNQTAKRTNESFADYKKK